MVWLRSVARLLPLLLLPLACGAAEEDDPNSACLWPCWHRASDQRRTKQEDDPNSACLWPCWHRASDQKRMKHEAVCAPGSAAGERCEGNVLQAGHALPGRAAAVTAADDARWSWGSFAGDLWLLGPLCLLLVVGWRHLPQEGPGVPSVPSLPSEVLRLYEGEPVEGEELEGLRAFVDERCRAHAERYHFQLELRAAYRLRSEGLERSFQEFQASLRAEGKPSSQRRLFHGTTAWNARSILRSGFTLPQKAGMFGKGIYFADCPLKSWQYCRVGGPMLLCDVEMGTSKLQRTAKTSMEPGQDFQRSWLMHMLGHADYDSVTAQSCVRVPEYVVYRPEQAVPRYALLLREAKKARQA